MFKFQIVFKSYNHVTNFALEEILCTLRDTHNLGILLFSTSLTNLDPTHLTHF